MPELYRRLDEEYPLVSRLPSSAEPGVSAVVNFINILQAAFALLFFWKKITKPKCK
jgi:hypothetical protein